jgi:hypothetical protein
MPSWAIYGNERRRGVRLQPAAVNLLLSPNAFDAADWNKGFLTVDAEAVTDPLAGSTAERLVEDNTTNYHELTQAVTKAATPTAYDFSVYAKADARGRICLQIDDGVDDGIQIVFDLQTPQVGVAPLAFGTSFTLGTTNITSVGSGWCLIEHTGFITGSETTIRVAFILDNATGTAVISTLYLGTTANAVHLYTASLTAA